MNALLLTSGPSPNRALRISLAGLRRVPHVPVHLGQLERSVRYVLERAKIHPFSHSADAEWLKELELDCDGSNGGIVEVPSPVRAGELAAGFHDRAEDRHIEDRRGVLVVRHGRDGRGVWRDVGDSAVAVHWNMDTTPRFTSTVETIPESDSIMAAICLKYP